MSITTERLGEWMIVFRDGVKIGGYTPNLQHTELVAVRWPSETPSDYDIEGFQHGPAALAWISEAEL